MSSDEEALAKFVKRHYNRDGNFKKTMEIFINDTSLVLEEGLVRDFMPQFFKILDESDRFIDIFSDFKAEIDGYQLSTEKIVPMFTEFFERVYHGLTFSVTKLSLMDAMVLLAFMDCYCGYVKEQALLMYFDRITYDVITTKLKPILLAFNLLYDRPKCIPRTDPFHQIIPQTLRWLREKFEVNPEIFFIIGDEKNTGNAYHLTFRGAQDYYPQDDMVFFETLVRIDRDVKKDVFAIDGFGDGCFMILQKHFGNTGALRRICGVQSDQ